jgi:hypothetical protein
MRLSTFLSASLVGSVSVNSWAVDPQHIDLAGFEFTPTLVLSEAYDDNFRGLPDADRQSSWVSTINPTLLLSAEGRKSAYQLEYSLNSETYHSDSDASNTDHHLRLKSIMEFTARHRLRWNLAYHRQEDTVDTANSEENDKYSRAIAGALYSYGVRSARNRLDFGANHETLRYHNSGNLNADKERDSLQLKTIWFHRLGGRTRSLVELRHTDHQYKLSESNRDSTNLAALAGATWKATAKTTGNVRIGAEHKDFDSETRQDYTSPMWEVGVAWQPRTYSTLRFDTRKAFDEGDDGASTIADQSNTLSWRHEWTSRIRSDLDYRYSDREYKGIERDDQQTSYGLGLTYSPDRWIDVTLGYRHTDNDSSLRTESYTRNIYLLSLGLSL